LSASLCGVTLVSTSAILKGLLGSLGILGVGAIKVRLTARAICDFVQGASGACQLGLGLHLERWVAIAVEGQGAITVLGNGVLGRILAICADAITKAVTSGHDVCEGHHTISLSDLLTRAVEAL